MTLSASVERASAIFLTRTMLGFVYFFAGVQRLGSAGGSVSAAAWLEIGVGALLLLGLWSRPLLRLLAVALVAYTLWVGAQGLGAPPRTFGATGMDIRIVNFYILPRAILVIVTLLLPAADDLFSLDAVLARRAISAA
jgi:uncharacterized membrane protein YphA (DoxX/SURF4 family)